jgi:hypothetical protein
MQNTGPVEPALDKAGNRRGAVLLNGAEVGERLEALGLRRRLDQLLLEVGLLRLAVIDLLAGQRDDHDAEEQQCHPGDQDIDQVAGAKRRGVASALVWRDEVDGAHQSPIANP